MIKRLISITINIDEILYFYLLLAGAFRIFVACGDSENEENYFDARKKITYP